MSDIGTRYQIRHIETGEIWSNNRGKQFWNKPGSAKSSFKIAAGRHTPDCVFDRVSHGVGYYSVVSKFDKQTAYEIVEIKSEVQDKFAVSMALLTELDEYLTQNDPNILLATRLKEFLKA